MGISTFSSSSKLKATWTAPSGFPVDHYVLTATENIFNTTETISVPFTQTTYTITGLKSATSYSVTVKACQNATCTISLNCSNTATATTSEEYWQVYGTPASGSYDGAYRLYANANVLSYAFPYGSWAPTAYQGKIRHYGTPKPQLNSSGKHSCAFIFSFCKRLYALRCQF